MIRLIRELFAKSALRREIINAYNLKLRSHPDPMISGSSSPYAWFGEASGVGYSMRFFHDWELIAGDLFPFIDFSLYAKGSPRGKKEYPRLEGVTVHYPADALGERFVLTQIGHRKSEYLGLQLREFAIERALLSLSPAAQGVTFYKRGVQLALDASRLTRSMFDQDLELAIDIARALQRRHSIEAGIKAHTDNCAAGAKTEA